MRAGHLLRVWIEGIFQKSDVEGLLAQLMPLTVGLGDEGDRLALAQPKDVAFVAGEGLRVQCEAKVRWSVLGIDVPITIHDVRVLLRPEIIRGEGGGDVLAFRLFIEHADVAGLPTVIDEHITDKVNAVLEARHLESTVDVTRLLSGSFHLPRALRPLSTLALDVAWAKLRITEEAIVLAVSFHANVTRDAEALAAASSGPAIVPARPGGESSGRLVRAVALAGGALTLAIAVAAGAYAGYRLARA